MPIEVDAVRSVEVPARMVHGPGAVLQLGGLLGELGVKRPLVVTDPGVVGAGLLDRVPVNGGVVFDKVRPNPDIELVGEASAVYREEGCDGLVAIGGGSPMDTAKGVGVEIEHGGSILDYEYGKTPITKRIPPLIAIPTTSGTGSEVTLWSVITDHDRQIKFNVGGTPLISAHVAVIDPELTLGLPPAVTAATGVDALTHSLESLLSRNGNPFAESTALGVIRTVHEWLPRAVADGSDLEARSQMLVASHLAGVGQASGTGVGLVHALGHALGTRGRLAHGTALAVVLPEVLAFYASEAGLRDRELALVGVAIRAASATEPAGSAAGAAIGELRRFLAGLDQRPTLGTLGFDDDGLDVVAQDAIDDAAIRNSPRLPTLAQARRILASVA
jgi:choline dehydrogenase